MLREIGSNFEFDEYIDLENKQEINWLPNQDDFAFSFSGRASIELAIKDIKQSKSINNVYMPSYSCDSMIEPFIKHGIEVDYYEVDYSKELGISYCIDTNKECDIFFAISYFGMGDYNLDNIIKKFADRGTIIIEDITHRLLSNSSHSVHSHYIIASLRKWFAIPTGGYITSQKGKIYLKPNANSDNLVEQKIIAMLDKSKYLKGESIEKNSFLKRFKEFEIVLKDVNYRYNIDKFSLDIIRNLNIEQIRNRRILNAKVLYEGIKHNENIKPLIPYPNWAKDCPLFVPIIVTNGQRDNLRRELIKNNIYCPIHWPKKHGKQSNIVEREISLICDQRYSIEDMKAIIEVINKWSQSFS